MTFSIHLLRIHGEYTFGVIVQHTLREWRVALNTTLVGPRLASLNHLFTTQLKYPIPTTYEQHDRLRSTSAVHPRLPEQRG